MNIKMEPRKQTDRGGFLMMPMVSNVPEPANETWEKTTCPNCGGECWARPLPEWLTEEMFDGKLCTECALRAVATK